MKKIFTLGLFLLTILGFAQTAVTKIYTDFNNYWVSGTMATPNPIYPNNSHNLLGFTWNNVTYSTGVNDTKLTSNALTFQPQLFKAFSSTFNTNTVTNNTFIGVGLNYGGSGNVSPVPVQNNLVNYLTDGNRGLDLGTGIFNYPTNEKLFFEINSIDPASIGDGVPDVLITQIGQIDDVNVDQFYFVNSANEIVGNKYLVKFGTVNSVGNANWKFYNANVNPPAYNGPTSSSAHRPLRLLAFDWSELGLTKDNQSQVKKLVQIFSGQSDLAFTAYNTQSINLKMFLYGNVYNDNDGGTPNGNGYAGAKVLLKNSGGTTVATATTDANGSYVFPNISSGNYSLQLNTPNGFVIVGNADGTTSDSLPITVANNPVVERNFGINQPPKASNDVISTNLNTPISTNIATNDVDPNGGQINESSVNLIAPAGAINTVTANGLLKGFRITNQGKWLVNNAGVLTFTPVGTFNGAATPVNYTLKDNANLTSNEATISIKVEEFCYKPAATVGITLDVTHGITALGRAGSENTDNWPMVRKGAWTALEGKTKGFVINRIATTANVDAIPNPVEGMIIYDEEANCLKIYTTTDNGATFSWKCFGTQACPQN